MATSVEVQSPEAVSTPPPEASLYIGDLDASVIESDLLRCFASFGPIHSVRVIRTRGSTGDDGGSPRYAYLNFLRRESAAEALAAMNHRPLSGRPMRIMWAQPGPTRSGNLFVKNLDPGVSGAHIEKVFGEFGGVLSCKVEAEEDGRSKGFAYVQMDGRDSAEAAIERLHGMKIEGVSNNLYVSHFVKKSERQTQSVKPQFTNLYIKNLERDFTDNDLRKKFSEFGNVSSAVIMKGEDGKSKGFGFVSFELAEHAQKAMDAMNGSILGSLTVYVGPAQRKEDREKLLKEQFGTKQKEEQPIAAKLIDDSNVYVRFLDCSVDDRMLEQHFSQCGKIVSVKVMLKPNGFSRGFGFVRFSSPEEANKAVAKLHGTEFCGKALYVAIAQRKEDRQKSLQRVAMRSYTPSAFYAQHYEQPLPYVSPLYQGGFHYMPQMQQDNTYYTRCLQQQENAYYNKWENSLRYATSSKLSAPFASLTNWSAPATQPAEAIPVKHTKYVVQTKQVPKQFVQPKPVNAASKLAPKVSQAYISSSSKKTQQIWCPRASPPLPEERKQRIGRYLYSKVQLLELKNAGRITDMLLEMSTPKLQEMMMSPKLLADKVKEAMQLLKNNQGSTKLQYHNEEATSHEEEVKAQEGACDKNHLESSLCIAAN